MFQENRNFPKRQRKPVKDTEEMRHEIQLGSVLPFSILVVIAVVILAAVMITAFSGWMKDETEPTDPIVTTAPTQAPTDPVVTTAPTQAPTETTAPVLAPGEIDWDLHGIWITPAGTTGTETELSVSGKVTLGEDGKDTMELRIDFPDTFDYLFFHPEAYSSMSRKFSGLPYCVGSTFGFSGRSKEMVVTYFALCPEKEYMIFWWDEPPERYLVASTDPNADPQEILEYFQWFIDFYIK